MPLIPDADGWRARFPIFAQKTYLNSCSQGALSHEVRAAYAAYLADWDALGSPWELWVERVEAARVCGARLIGADADELAVMTSVSAGVSALMSCFDFRGGRDTILVGDYAFPTVGQIAHAQEPRSARVVHVPLVDGVTPAESFAALIDERTAIVALSHVSFRSGARQDNIAAIADMAHARGALVLLDSYQAIGSLPINVRQLDVDFLVAGSLKYLLASAGLGFLYVRRALLPRLTPTALGWFSQENIFAMDIYHNTPAATARRFESGTPSVPNLYAGVAGMALVQQIGVANIEAHVRELTDHLIAGALELGCALATPQAPERRGAMVAIRARDVNALVARLAERGVVVSSREQNLRVSPHFYNSHADIERLLEGLHASRDLLS